MARKILEQQTPSQVLVVRSRLLVRLIPPHIIFQHLFHHLNKACAESTMKSRLAKVAAEFEPIVQPIRDEADLSFGSVCHAFHGRLQVFVLARALPPASPASPPNGADLTAVAFGNSTTTRICSQ